MNLSGNFSNTNSYTQKQNNPAFGAVFIKAPKGEESRKILNKVDKILKKNNLKFVFTEGVLKPDGNIFKLQGLKTKSIKHDNSNDAKLVAKLTKQKIDAWV